MGNRNDKDEPMKAKARRERRLAKIVEMRLDGVEGDLRGFKYKELLVMHDDHKTAFSYWGKSTMQMLEERKILRAKAAELQRSMDKALLEELTNGKPS